jgi:hypothetical protein
VSALNRRFRRPYVLLALVLGLIIAGAGTGRTPILKSSGSVHGGPARHTTALTTNPRPHPTQNLVIAGWLVGIAAF